jgi:uncharacterized protein DUF2877
MPTKKEIHSNLLIAESVGHRTLKALSGSRRMKVHSVFDHAFYIQIGNNSLATVIKNKNYISPTSILLKNSKDRSFKSIGIVEEMKVKFDEHALIFGDNVLVIKLGRASTWFSPLFPKNSLMSLTDISLNLRVLRDVIYTCPSPSREGLIPLLENVELYGALKLFLHPQEPTLSERARPNIETLMWGLFRGDFDTVISKALSILGLGPGLTPSCDDFFTGLILSLTIGGKVLLKKKKSELDFHRRVSAEICRVARGKTTIYSQTFLNQARFGEGPKAVVELIHSLLTKNPNYVAAASKTVINMGETSGADIAVGIYYGIRFLLSKLELSELERELHEIA